MSIKKRHIFYLSGFDPRGARYYHRLYREQSALQSKISGLKIDVSPRFRPEPHSQCWRLDAVQASAPDEVTHTEYEFLEWDDIVRRNWASESVSILADLLYCIWVYVLSGLVFAFAKASPKQMMAAFYPVVYILFSFFLSYTAWYATLHLTSSWLPWWLSAFVGLLPAWAVLKLSGKLGNRIGVFWLLRIYAFSARWASGEIDGVDERITEFATRIHTVMTEAEEEGIDEVLVISHSVGTILMVPILAQVIERGLSDAKALHRFGVITLGECIPLLSFQRGADVYRSALHVLASQKELFWIDYTSPIDGACFPLLDFVKASGVEVCTNCGPKLFSPRFYKRYTKQRYAKLRRDWYTTHFLYLMAGELPGGYDYFGITAGPKPLASFLRDTTETKES